jgi:hypothetical protein
LTKEAYIEDGIDAALIVFKQTADPLQKNISPYDIKTRLFTHIGEIKLPRKKGIEER